MKFVPIAVAIAGEFLAGNEIYSIKGLVVADVDIVLGSGSVALVTQYLCDH